MEKTVATNNFLKLKNAVPYTLIGLDNFTRPGITVTTRDLLSYILQNPDTVLPVYQIGLNSYGKLERVNAFTGIEYRSDRVRLYKFLTPSNFLLNETGYDVFNRTSILLSDSSSLNDNINTLVKAMVKHHIDSATDWFIEGRDLKYGLKSLPGVVVNTVVSFRFTVWSSLIEQPDREVPFSLISIYADHNLSQSTICGEYHITLKIIEVSPMSAQNKELISNNLSAWDEIRTAVDAEAIHQQNVIINSKNKNWSLT